MHLHSALLVEYSNNTMNGLQLYVVDLNGIIVIYQYCTVLECAPPWSNSISTTIRGGETGKEEPSVYYCILGPIAYTESKY